MTYVDPFFTFADPGIVDAGGPVAGVYPYGFYPADPYIGMAIFDSTFGNVLYYYGPILGWRPNWGTAWGFVTDIQLASTYAVTTAEADITGLTVSWTAVQNRKYLVRMNIRYSSAPESIGTTVVLTDAGNIHKMEQTVSVQGTSQNKGKELTLTERYLAYGSGTVTRKGRASKSAPADTKNLGPDNSIDVFDLGPFGGPAYLPLSACLWNSSTWNSCSWS